MRSLALSLATLPTLAAAQSIDLARARTVDLTHPYNAQTIYWPNAPSTFKLEKLAFGKSEGGWFYSSFAYSSPEHGGTHLDAPIHFSEKGRTADQVPLSQLIAPAVVLDISAKARTNADYRLSVEDVRQFEKTNGAIKPGTIVLL